MKEKNELSLHILQEGDISRLVETFNFPWTSLEATQEKWKKYYAEQNANIRTVCIAKMQDEFVGLSAENYIVTTKTSRATATRDLADLVTKGALIKTGELRHTRYWLKIIPRG